MKVVTIDCQYLFPRFAASYLVISANLFGGHLGGPLLMALLGFGGLGLGIGITANIRLLTAAAPARYAPDMSGLITTAAQIAGVFGIATFGTVYFSLVPTPDPVTATRGFAIVSVGFGITAILAAVAAYMATRPRTVAEPAIKVPQLLAPAVARSRNG